MPGPRLTGLITADEVGCDGGTGGFDVRPVKPEKAFVFGFEFDVRP